LLFGDLIFDTLMKGWAEKANGGNQKYRYSIFSESVGCLVPSRLIVVVEMVSHSSMFEAEKKVTDPWWGEN